MTTNKSPNKSSIKAAPKKPAKPRAKKLTLSHIESQQKNINKMETFILDEEQNLQLKYYPVFSEERIQQLLTEAYSALNYVSDHDLDFFNTDEEFVKFIYFLTIRHFTSLKDEIPENDFPAQVSIMSQIIDIGLFHKIYDEVFDPEEVLKIMDRLQQFVELTSKIDELSRKELEKAERLIVNKDVIHPLVNPKPDSNA